VTALKTFHTAVLPSTSFAVHHVKIPQGLHNTTREGSRVRKIETVGLKAYMLQQSVYQGLRSNNV
jgi:hypothetical protein